MGVGRTKMTEQSGKVGRLFLKAVLLCLEARSVCVLEMRERSIGG